MELYACGFNAHAQLSLSTSTEDSPKDIYTLRKILTGNSIRLLFAGWSTTVVEVDGTLRSNRGVIKLPTGCLAQDINSVFGDHTGILGALTFGGDLLVHKLSEDGEELNLASSSPASIPDDAIPRIARLTVSGIGEVCISPSTSGTTPPANASIYIGAEPHHLHTHPSLSSLLQSSTDTTQILPQPPLQLTSNANSFAALLPSGSIYTWGDPRHQHLGRTPTTHTPAQQPSLVAGIGGVPMKKLASGGWMTGAVSRDGDLYLWGRQPPGLDEGKQIGCLPGTSRTTNMSAEEEQFEEGEVALVDIDGGVDVVDVGVGAGHILALTRDGRIFGVGDNRNGQIGIGEGEGRGFCEDWMEVPIGFENEQKVIVQVDCGYCSSFVLVRLTKSRIQKEPGNRVEFSVSVGTQNSNGVIEERHSTTRYKWLTVMPPAIRYPPLGELELMFRPRGRIHECGSPLPLIRPHHNCGLGARLDPYVDSTRMSIRRQGGVVLELAQDYITNPSQETQGNVSEI